MSLGSIFGALFFFHSVPFCVYVVLLLFFSVFFLRVRLLRVISIKKKTV